MTSEPTKERLSELLDHLDAADLECDGLSRCVTTILHSHSIVHQVMAGTLTVNESIIRLHFWVCSGPFVIDYRARMWLGDQSTVPHGIVASEGPWIYRGQPIHMAPLDRKIMAMLLMPFPLRDLALDKITPTS